ncbi:MAG: radical SAM protein [Desulfobacterales bacterium]|nr:radical SAM protein [Desulfobacterales bacterium]
MQIKSEQYFLKQYSREANLWHDAPNFLKNLTIEFTERCNNDCIHCCINLPEDDVKAKRKELTTDQIKKIFTEAASIGCLQIMITGGEPLLREDFEELYIFARKLGLKVLLFTNATLIHRDLVKLFKQIPPLVEIEVTVYGMEKVSYEGITRKKGTFEEAWRGIRLLQEYNIPFVVKSVALPQNIKDLSEFKKWASKIPWMDQEAVSYKFFGLRLRRDNFEKNTLIKKLRAHPKEIVEEEDEIIKSFHNAINKFSHVFFKPSAEKLFSCHGGLNGGCVDAYGNLQLCILLRHPDTLYNLKHGSLREGFEKHFPKIRNIKAVNPDYLNRCGICFLRNICEQCPGQSWMEHGTLDTPVNYVCDITHIKARYLGIISETEKTWEVDNWEDRIMRFDQTVKGKSG